MSDRRKYVVVRLAKLGNEQGMDAVEQIIDWRGQDVYDCDGERLGKLEEVFFDAADGEARFATVKSGLLGRHVSLVPLADASVGRDYVRVAFPAERVHRAEDAAVADELGAESIRRIVEVYDLELPSDARYESATLVAGRLAQANDALRHADELEQKALNEAEAAKNARRDADAAQRAADAAERAAVHAHEDAVAARETADTAAAAAGIRRVGPRAEP